MEIENEMIKAVRGTRDILPPETALWNFVESVVRDVFRAYNFQEIRTPIFESTELFARGVGEETDIVSKEMYTWYDGNNPVVALQAAWIAQYSHKYDRIKQYGPRSLTGHSNDHWTLIHLKYEPNIADLRDIEKLQTAEWSGGETQEPVAKPTLAIAAPEDKIGVIRELAGDIEIQPVRMPDWFEAPASLTLRPEATAGIVRAYIEHKLGDRGLNKLYCIGPMFRRERPQKGRYRQFYQIDAEIIGPASAGSESPARDAELLEMLATLLDRLGIKNWTLELNSVGSSAERAKFNEALRVALAPVKGQMCADCQRRAVTNPLRVLDCKHPADQPIIEKLPRITDFLDDESREKFADLRAILDAVGVPYHLNPRLVRGLDYYTRTAFEFTHGALGAQNAILGGGRYDGLSEALGGPRAPGIGFAIGEDRLILALQESSPPVLKGPHAYIAPIGEGMNIEAAKLARELRRHDLVIELGDRNFKLKKSFETATKSGAKYILMVGEDEVKADAFALKNLATGIQISVPRAELVRKIQE
jgi:histidyl-tRNA synthetase